MKKYLQHNPTRFAITFLLCLLYSLFREEAVSTILKPLPVIFWLLVAIFSKRQAAGKWVIVSLSFAFLGDILLDLGDKWLKIGAIPFLSSTAFLAWAFHVRLKQANNTSTALRKSLIFLLIAMPFVLLFITLIRYSTDAARVGGALFILSVFLLSTSLSNLLYNESEKNSRIKSLAGFLGACGIVANYVLYSIDLYMTPIPRDLVIQVYYWGTALVTWSYLEYV